MKQPQPVISDYPADMKAGTDLFFVEYDIIEHQHTAGVKEPYFRLIDTERKLSDGQLESNSFTSHKAFQELHFKKLVRETIFDHFIELVTVTGHYVPFVDTDRVLTLKFGKSEMQCYYSRQVVLLQFSGLTRQLGSGFRLLAAGVGRVSLPFAKEVILPCG